MNPHGKMQNLTLANLGGAGDNNFHNPPTPFTMIMENPALDALDDSESDNENDRRNRQQSPNSLSLLGHQPDGTGLKPGKKTKGRVKIKMEFIENKLRRYTTFSKRKTGIMKKAYELSTLTGTQVMLLVASETGHVYTFATRKLQPMITSESGKNLIQTCLNSPENGTPVISQNCSLDQRMNPTGFEEMELSYAVGEDDTKGENKYVYAANPVYDGPSSTDTVQHSTFYSTASQPAFPTPTTYIPITTETNNNADGGDIKPSSGSVQLTSAGVTAILQSGSAAASLQQAANSVAELTQAITTSSNSSNTASSLSSANAQSLMTPSIVMYQTPQGLVYATPTSATLPGGSIFNFQQSAQSLSQSESIQQGTQYITIPMPVSLPGSTQLLQIAGKVDSGVTLDYSQPTAPKKAKK